MFFPWCERDVFLFECQRLIRDDFWVSFFFLFFGEVIKRDRWKGAEWIQMKSLCFITLRRHSSSPYLTLRVFFFCFFFGLFVCRLSVRPEEMFDVIIHKIFESSVCVRCQQIAIEQKLERSSERIVFEGHAGRYKAADGPSASAEISSWIDDLQHRDVHYALQISAAHLFFFLFFNIWWILSFFWAKSYN